MYFKVLIIILTVLLGFQKAEGKPFFAIGYGLGSYSDEKKQDLDFKLKGSPFKFVLGARSGHLELETFARFGNYSGKFRHDSVDNEILHEEKSFGIGFGIYTISALRLHFGYALHMLDEQIDKDVSDIETQEIKDQYGIEQQEMLLGPYAGADFHLFTLGPIKFVVSGTVYFLSGNGGRSYEGLFNLKIPFNGPNIGSSASNE